MIAPRALRELSWAASKLREVAKTLSALEVRLTVDPGRDKMTGLEPIESWTKGSVSSGPAGAPDWVQSTLPLGAYEGDGYAGEETDSAS